MANQGWKDSVDAVRYADGGLAEAPIALCEVQGYAYEAAVQGAALLADFGEPPVDGLAEWAASLRRRFQSEFWVDTPEGGHVAIALDGTGAKVDSVASKRRLGLLPPLGPTGRRLCGCWRCRPSR